MIENVHVWKKDNDVHVPFQYAVQLEGCFQVKCNTSLSMSLLPFQKFATTALNVSDKTAEFKSLYSITFSCQATIAA